MSSIKLHCKKAGGRLNVSDLTNLPPSLSLGQIKAIRKRTRRWFIYCLVGLFVFLCGGIVLAAFLLLQRGKLPKQGIVAGSSMEPLFAGPRFKWTCTHCSSTQEFSLDSCKSHQPFRCMSCNFLNSESEVDFDDPDSVADRIEPGAPVRYETLRSTRKSRATDIEIGTVHSSGLRRGDVIVLQDTLRANREIKRIVGFPDEEVAIREGDVFVDGSRWTKSLEQSLRQSILLCRWDGTHTKGQTQHTPHREGAWRIADQNFTGVIEFKEAIPLANATNELTYSYHPPHWIDNRLDVNAHDSHAIVPVNDFGIAWQLAELESSWRIRCKFLSPCRSSQIELNKTGKQLEIRCEDRTATTELPEVIDKSIWIVLTMVDGFMVAGNQDEEWLRVELPTEDSPDRQDDSTTMPISMQPLRGKMTIDQLLVFRDIHYRGYGDSESQTWPPDDRVIVLGDNVSISSDSRERWPEGLPLPAIKGLVQQPESPIEVLLRQK